MLGIARHQRPPSTPLKQSSDEQPQPATTRPTSAWTGVDLAPRAVTGTQPMMHNCLGVTYGGTTDAQFLGLRVRYSKNKGCRFKKEKKNKSIGNTKNSFKKIENLKLNTCCRTSKTIVQHNRKTQFNGNEYVKKK